MFETVLVANRGEIACRVVRTCQRLGIKAVTVHSEADAKARHAVEADESLLLGPAPAAQSYLDAARLVEAARQSGAQAVHPGYGFLAEDPGFAQAVLDAGLAWIGPSPDVLTLMADKVRARAAAAAAGVPVLPGSSAPLTDVEEAVRVAAGLGYPLMVKPAAGGGGIGMGVAADERSLRQAFATATARAGQAFGSPAVLLERCLSPARHVEVQLLGLADGRVVALGERDCSVQRRHQKVVEESPSPGLDPWLRARLVAAAVALGEAVGYRGAGTVECLVSGSELVFLEMNTRLQVEHPVTEATHGVDLVEQQLRIAAGLPPSYDVDAAPVGAAVELRVYAEDPVRFLPGPGRITRWVEPAGDGVRVDSGYREGDEVTPFYDPLLAKLVVSGADRDQALARARAAVAGFVVEGPRVNLPFLAAVLDDPEFVSGRYDTGLVDRMRAR